jgi:hypothetical protein
MATSCATFFWNVPTGNARPPIFTEEFLDQAYPHDKILRKESCKTPWSAAAPLPLFFFLEPRFVLLLSLNSQKHIL